MFGHEDETGVSRSEVDHQAFGRLLGGSQVHPDSADPLQLELIRSHGFEINFDSLPER